MAEITKIQVHLTVQDNQNLPADLHGLPDYCVSSFSEHSNGKWSGEFVISCPVAPHLADGDFVDDFAPYFRKLLELKTFYDAEFHLQVAVGAPASDLFELPSHMVALLAALGAKIRIVKN